MQAYVVLKIDDNMINKVIHQAKNKTGKVITYCQIGLEDLMKTVETTYKEMLNGFVEKLDNDEMKLYKNLVELENDHDSYIYYDVDKKILHQLAYSFPEKYIDYLKEVLHE